MNQVKESIVKLLFGFLLMVGSFCPVLGFVIAGGQITELQATFLWLLTIITIYVVDKFSQDFVNVGRSEVW